MCIERETATLEADAEYRRSRLGNCPKTVMAGANRGLLVAAQQQRSTQEIHENRTSRLLGCE